MQDISNWSYYYNTEDNEWGREQVRANLVYTPRVSPDKSTFCLDFNRDRQYHCFADENRDWNEFELDSRFKREVKAYELAHLYMPTLAIKDVDYTNRRVFIEWHGDDFYMQGFNQEGNYDKVCSDWKAQWLSLFKVMQNRGLYKISLHPNSFVVHKDVLIPFNWFFTYEKSEPLVTFRSLLIQISAGRQDKLNSVLDTYGVTLDTPLELNALQRIALNSFRSNYPSDLIDEALTYVL